MLKEIVYPDHVKAGIRPALRDFPLPKNLRLFGADTETVRGNPHTVQVHDGRETFLAYVDKTSVFEEFWEWTRPRAREGGVNICYFHNLNFDLRVLFANFHLDFYEQYNEVTLRLGLDYKKLAGAPEPGRELIEVRALFGKVNTARIYQGSYGPSDDGRKLILRPTVKLDVYDSFAFTQTSLARSLKMFGVEGNKLAKPHGLGKFRDRSPEFEAYAKTDAEVEYRLGEKILAFHEEYKVRPSISLSQFSGRVFRRYFFDKGATIQATPDEVSRPAELSYHAGKNGFYLDGPTVKEDVYEIDINSAFPYAMSELPQMVEGSFEAVKKYRPGLHGIYKISGAVLGGKYPLVYDHGFKPVSGKFKELWATGYEVERMRASPYVVLKKCEGFVWKPGPFKGRNSFRDFVLHFYEKKAATPKTDPHYNFYKIVLNALYGRFAASVEVRTVEKAPEEETFTDDVTGRKVSADYRSDAVTGELVKVRRVHRAGGMTNFFVASLITGKTRAMLYDLETKYAALHSATDSIKTLVPPMDVPGLGGYKLECFGRCYFFRNKLYLHFAKSFDDCSHGKREDGSPKSPGEIMALTWDDGQHLCKAAYHGFKGRGALLFRKRRHLLDTHHLVYRYTHVVGLREGMKRRETPCDFKGRAEVLCLCKGDHGQELCRGFGFRCHCPTAKTSSPSGRSSTTRTRRAAASAA